MVRNLALLSIGIVIGVAALLMNATVTSAYHNDLSFAPDSPNLSTHPITTKQYFRPGSGVATTQF